jgi:hypothetical protein
MRKLAAAASTVFLSIMKPVRKNSTLLVLSIMSVLPEKRKLKKQT